MKEIKKDWRSIKLRQGDMLVVYRGTGDSPDNCVAVKGNFKRDKAVKSIFKIIVFEY